MSDILDVDVRRALRGRAPGRRRPGQVGRRRRAPALPRDLTMPRTRYGRPTGCAGAAQRRAYPRHRGAGHAADVGRHPQRRVPLLPGRRPGAPSRADRQRAGGEHHRRDGVDRRAGQIVVSDATAALLHPASLGLRRALAGRVLRSAPVLPDLAAARSGITRLDVRRLLPPRYVPICSRPPASPNTARSRSRSSSSPRPTR